MCLDRIVCILLLLGIHFFPQRPTDRIYFIVSKLFRKPIGKGSFCKSQPAGIYLFFSRNFFVRTADAIGSRLLGFQHGAVIILVYCGTCKTKKKKKKMSSITHFTEWPADARICLKYFTETVVSNACTVYSIFFTVPGL